MRIKSVLQVRILYGVLISLLMIVVSCVEKMVIMNQPSKL